MEALDFVTSVSNFNSLSHPEKIKLFTWFLHTQRRMERVDGPAIKGCYQEIHMVPPDMSIYLPRLASQKPPALVKDRLGYRLEGAIRRALDDKYGEHPTVISVTRILTDLPARVPDLSERSFLTESINCYRVKAFRAAIVMVWNLTFDHLLRWILSDQNRLGVFNSAVARRYPKRTGLLISKFDDFEELKEFETLEILRTTSLVSKDVQKILDEKLKKRNSAAHPSAVVVTQHQADDAITDLVNNVVLSLN
jgi:hypothetical protein